MQLQRMMRLGLPSYWTLVAILAQYENLVLAAGGDHPWCYDEEKCGPSHWSGICKTGHSQSPIDIHPPSVIPGRHLEMMQVNKEYLGTFSEFWIKNNGHTVQVQLTEEMTSPLYIGGDGFRGNSYQFSQMHFHWGNTDDVGSEHTVDGNGYAMELHLVHFSSKYDTILAAITDQNSRALAVLGIFFQVSKYDNPALNPIIDALYIVEDYHPDATKTKTTPLNVSSFFPNDMEAFRYEGSLTTPSCAEKVVWTVFRNPVPISRRQIEAFRKVKDNAGHILVNNFRPTQPLTRRKVLTGTLGLSVVENEILHAVVGKGHSEEHVTDAGSKEEMSEIPKPTKNIEEHDTHSHNHTSEGIEHDPKSAGPREVGTSILPILSFAWLGLYSVL